MTIRLHPATPHAGTLHRLTLGGSDGRVGLTRCRIWFAFGDWKGRTRVPLPRCTECWS